MIKILEKDTSTSIDWFTDNSLSANPDKFQAMIVSKTSHSNVKIELKGTEIKLVDTMKTLGVNVDKHLDFKLHVSEICVKASKQLNVLRRLSKYLNESCLLTIYKSFITSSFNYCPVVWIFCGKKSSAKLEKLNERALRIVYKDSISSYTDLLKKAKALSLSMLRLKFMILEVFKCVHKSNPAYMNDMIVIKDPKHSFRDESITVQEMFKTKAYGFRSFPYFGSKL